jgi:pyruvate kinase
MQIDLIIVSTKSGKMAKLVAKYRPSVPILACTTDLLVIKNLAIVRGVISCEVKDSETDMA